MRLPISDRGVLCIDWDERSLRVLDAGFSRSDVRIRNALHVPLTPGTDVRDPASLGDFLRRTLGEHRIRTRRAIVDIPRQDAVLNLLTLPDASTDELAAMVHIQIAKDLPFSKEQAVVDFAVAREEGANTCEVWVSAVRNHVIDHYRQVMATAGLKLGRIGLRPYANLVAVTEDGAAGGRTLTVDVGPSMAEINVVRDGRLVYSRAASVSVPVGGLSTRGVPAATAEPSLPEGTDATIPLADDFLPKPGPMDALLIEVSRTIEAYRATDPGATIDRIVLSGTAGIDDQVCEAFADRFNARTTAYEVPPSLRWRPKAGASAAPFSAVIGLAISNVTEEMRHFDFLHPKEPEAARRERAKRMPMIAATVALFVAAAGVAAYQPLRARSARISRLDQQLAEPEQVEKDRKAFMKKYKDVEEWQRRSVIWIDQLQRIAEVFPSNKEGYISKLDCDDKGRITMELAVKDEKVATKLITSVKAIRSIKDTSVPLFSIAAEFESALDKGTISPELRKAFADSDVRLSPEAAVSVGQAGGRWTIGDGGKHYLVMKDGRVLGTYRAVALFEAEPGEAKPNKKDPTYGISDKVEVQIKSLKREK